MNTAIQQLLTSKPLVEQIGQFASLMSTRYSVRQESLADIASRRGESVREREEQCWLRSTPLNVADECAESGERPAIERAFRAATKNMPCVTLDELLESVVEHLVITEIQDNLRNRGASSSAQSQRDAWERLAISLERRTSWQRYEQDAVEVGAVWAQCLWSSPLRFKLADEVSLVLFVESHHVAGTTNHKAWLGLEGHFSPVATKALLTVAGCLCRVLMPVLLTSPPPGRKLTKQNVVRRLETLEQLLKTFFSSPTKKQRLEQTIQNALVMITEAASQSRSAVGMALYVVAIETMLTTGRSGLADQVSSRASVLFARSPGERSRVIAGMKRLYDLRSRVLHGDAIDIDEEHSQAARTVAIALLRAVLCCAESRRAASSEDLQRELDSLFTSGRAHPLRATLTSLLDDAIWGPRDAK